MSPERRAAERHSRRLEVRFWRQGKVQAYSGFTTNISVSGLFLGTTQRIEPGERLRLEVLDRKAGFIVEGLVARVHRVSISLRHVDQPGAGVRFLVPAELVGGLVPALRDRTAGVRAQRSALGRGEREATAVAEQAADDGDSGEGVAEGGPAAGAEVEGQRLRVAKSEHAAPPQAAPGEPPVIPVDFSDRSSFLSVYHRDLSAGTLFISTDVPAAVDDFVLIDLQTPVATDAPLRFRAKVVHRFAPEAAVGKGRNVLSGMGVRFTDLEQLRQALAPVLAELRR